MIRPLLHRIATTILRGTRDDPELLRAALVASQLRCMRWEERALKAETALKARDWFVVRDAGVH